MKHALCQFLQHIKNIHSILKGITIKKGRGRHRTRITHRKTVRRKRTTGRNPRVLPRGRQLSQGQLSTPCSIITRSGTPDEHLEGLPARRVTNRTSNRLAPLPQWSSSGGFTVTWYVLGTWQATVTSIFSKRGSNPCGRTMPTKMVVNGLSVCERA